MAAIILFRARQRRILRRERVFRDRINPIDKYDDAELLCKFRFSRQHILDLTDVVEKQLVHANRVGALPPVLQVCLALRFYAIGSFQSACGELLNVSQPTASRTISAVTQALLSLVPQGIRFPDQDEAELQKVKFYGIARFPGVFGCVDGTHIPIQSPPNNEHEYVNRKNVHSINVQVICDADMIFIDVVAKWPGSVHDSRVLRESGIFNAMEQVNQPVRGYLLGDSGYMLRTWLLTPILNPLTRSEQQYNNSHTSTRSTVECAIGVCKRRWSCLRKLRLSPAKACDVITVCFMLHNRARRLNLPEPDGDEGNNGNSSDDEDDDDNGNLHASEQARVAAGKAERQRVINKYF
ncbi:putative nuclease HARBI1 [Pomacea canaliculata]|nr:putative nuclease HARBI1 [Pomacea canaliculata]